MEDRLWPRASQWVVTNPDETSNVDVLIVGVPSSVASISESHARETPAAFRDALAGFSPYDSERRIDLTTVAVADRGALPLDDTTMERSQADIERLLEPTDAVTVLVGGDNAITRPAMRALTPDLGTAGLVTLDAHHDVRVLDHGPTNGTPVRGLIDDGLPGSHIVQIGIHSFANSAAYRRYCDDHGVSVFAMADVETRGMEAVVADALRRLSHVDWIYVDFDIDVLDRTFAPACPGARPGGCTPRQLGEAAYHLGRDRRVGAADLVEVDVRRDINGATVQTMVHTFLSFVAGIAERGRT